MRNLFFAAAIAVALFASCSLERENQKPKPATEGAECVITFDKAGGQFDTRAFFDNTVKAEPWENEIRWADIYVYNPEGKIIMHKSFSAADITSLSTTLILPKNVAGTECTFYAVANNYTYSRMFGTENELLNSNTEDVASFNNNYFSAYSSGTSSAMPLAMSASKKAVVQPQGTPTEVSFVLKRALAKVAVKVSVDNEAFAAKYHGGKIMVNYVEVVNAASRVAVVPPLQIPVMPMEYSLNQSSQGYSNGEYCNLFYLGENPPLDDDAKVILRIKALFDQDGSFMTSNDQIPFEWDLKINGSGNGEIKRNGYYRISAQIVGIDALDNIKSFISAGEWESPVTPPTETLH